MTGTVAATTANSPRAAGRPGEVTYGELFNVQPFGNVMTVLTMTGDGITVVTRFVDNSVMAAFGFPRTLPR